MRDNSFLNIMEFWTRKKIPYVFDETLSLYQNVRLTVKYLNEVIEDQNELKNTIKEFIEMFDEDLEGTVIMVLEQWRDDGSLKEIINEALFESKLDKAEFEKYKKDNDKAVSDLNINKVDKDQHNKDINNLNETIKNEVAEVKKNMRGVNQLIYGEDGKGIFFMHRGLSQYFPENTYKSFDMAGYHGAKGLEMDIVVTKDGKFVVIHDETLDRTTNGKGYVKDKTLDQIKELKITSGKNIGLFNNEKVPELSEILYVIQRYHMHAILELKGNNFTKENIIDLIALIDQHSLRNSVGLMSFVSENLELIREVDKDINIGFVMSQYSPSKLEYVKSLGNCFMSLNYNIEGITNIVKTADREGVPVTLWTVNSIPDMIRFMRYGVRSITSDLIKGSKPKTVTKQGVFVFRPATKTWEVDNRFDSMPFILENTTSSVLRVVYVVPFGVNEHDNWGSVPRGITRTTFWGGLNKPYTIGTIGERATNVEVTIKQIPEMSVVSFNDISDTLYVGFTAIGQDFMP